MKKTIICLLGCLIVLSIGCASKRTVTSDTNRLSDSMVGGPLPQAYIYKTNGDWNNYVPVNLNSEGTMVVSFPGPSDLNPPSSSKPIEVGEGYLMGGWNITPTSAFTRWTYEEYCNLPFPPADFMNNLIPGAKVTEIVSLPFTANQANMNPEIVTNAIKEGLKGATVIFRRTEPVELKEVVDSGEPGPRPILLTTPDSKERVK